MGKGGGINSLGPRVRIKRYLSCFGKVRGKKNGEGARNGQMGKTGMFTALKGSINIMLFRKGNQTKRGGRAIGEIGRKKETKKGGLRGKKLRSGCFSTTGGGGEGGVGGEKIVRTKWCTETI